MVKANTSSYSNTEKSSSSVGSGGGACVVGRGRGNEMFTGTINVVGVGCRNPVRVRRLPKNKTRGSIMFLRLDVSRFCQQCILHIHFHLFPTLKY